MHFQSAILQVLGQLSATITLLSPEAYVLPSKYLSNATIGQHTRHIIEMFQCLITGYETGLVNYEKRPRNIQLETVPEEAIAHIQLLYSSLSKPDIPLKLETDYPGNTDEPILLETNFFREIAYTLEHAIHHMALIRVGLLETTAIQLPEGFGVAPSTLKFRQSCAQ